ncbi:MAG: flagellar hook-length control protein FliK [Melioribacteraceae bacterium]|nr:flagellar hook-length control protein FliK [Melioribacteraceae bacterium]MCF8353729.1 flagellar hook-length control protein FliK [Melioribacteraceae bacterium]MCF8392462.1 flagellar hook-length control protein FliK [Melioribacteraceae bacterium]MCF8418373.1 flagellar hook-length control protein FliK [Melioribacteraceae bacterium]
MILNSLFLQNNFNSENSSAANNGTQKRTNNYLFADIIKLASGKEQSQIELMTDKKFHLPGEKSLPEAVEELKMLWNDPDDASKFEGSESVLNNILKNIIDDILEQEFPESSLVIKDSGIKKELRAILGGNADKPELKILQPKTENGSQATEIEKVIESILSLSDENSFVILDNSSDKQNFIHLEKEIQSNPGLKNLDINTGSEESKFIMRLYDFESLYNAAQKLEETSTNRPNVVILNLSSFQKAKTNSENVEENDQQLVSSEISNAEIEGKGLSEANENEQITDVTEIVNKNLDENITVSQSINPEITNKEIINNSPLVSSTKQSDSQVFPENKSGENKVNSESKPGKKLIPENENITNKKHASKADGEVKGESITNQPDKKSSSTQIPVSSKEELKQVFRASNSSNIIENGKSLQSNGKSDSPGDVRVFVYKKNPGLVHVTTSKQLEEVQKYFVKNGSGKINPKENITVNGQTKSEPSKIEAGLANSPKKGSAVEIELNEKTVQQNKSNNTAAKVNGNNVTGNKEFTIDKKPVNSNGKIEQLQTEQSKSGFQKNDEIKIEKSIKNDAGKIEGTEINKAEKTTTKPVNADPVKISLKSPAKISASGKINVHNTINRMMDSNPSIKVEQITKNQPGDSKQNVNANQKLHKNFEINFSKNTHGLKLSADHSKIEGKNINEATAAKPIQQKGEIQLTNDLKTKSPELNSKEIISAEKAKISTEHAKVDQVKPQIKKEVSQSGMPKAANSKAPELNITNDAAEKKEKVFTEQIKADQVKPQIDKEVLQTDTHKSTNSKAPELNVRDDAAEKKEKVFTGQIKVDHVKSKMNKEVSQTDSPKSANSKAYEFNIMDTASDKKIKVITEQIKVNQAKPESVKEVTIPSMKPVKNENKPAAQKEVQSTGNKVIENESPMTRKSVAESKETLISKKSSPEVKHHNEPKVIASTKNPESRKIDAKQESQININERVITESDSSENIKINEKPEAKIINDNQNYNRAKIVGEIKSKVDENHFEKVNKDEFTVNNGSETAKKTKIENSVGQRNIVDEKSTAEKYIHEVKSIEKSNDTKTVNAEAKTTQNEIKEVITNEVKHTSQNSEKPSSKEMDSSVKTVKGSETESSNNNKQSASENSSDKNSMKHTEHNIIKNKSIEETDDGQNLYKNGIDKNLVKPENENKQSQIKPEIPEEKIITEQPLPAGEKVDRSSDTNSKHNMNINDLKNDAKVEHPNNERVVDNLTDRQSRTVKLNEVIKDVSKFIERHEKNSMVLTLDPKELGRVKLNIDVIDKIVYANFEVDSEAVRKVIETQINQLNSNLHNAGLQIGSYNVSLSNSDSKYTKGSEGKRKGNQSKDDEVNGAESFSDTDKQKLVGYNTYDFLV